MRDIRFRGYSKTKKSWIYGLPAYHKKEIYAIETTEQTIIQVDPKTISQYTGLKDISDKEIYEGDIVKAYDFNFDIYFRGIVGFGNGNFVIKNKTSINYDFSDYEIEIIGNVFKNKKILEVKQHG